MRFTLGPIQQAKIVPAQPLSGKAAEWAEAFDAVRRDLEFVAHNERRLTKAYPDEWIAVQNGAVLVHSSDRDVVLEDITCRGIRRQDVVIEFLPTLRPNLRL